MYRQFILDYLFFSNYHPLEGVLREDAFEGQCAGPMCEN